MDAFATGLVIHLAVKVTGIIVLAWLVVRLGKSLSAAWQHAIWSLALASLLLLPVLAPLLPGWHVAGLSSGLISTAATPPPASAAKSSLLAPVELEPASTGGNRRGSVRTPLHPRRPYVATQINRPGASLLQTSPLAVGALLLWSAGMVLLLGRLVGSVMYIRRVTREARPLGYVTNETPVTERTRLPDIQRDVRMACSPNIQVPLVWGLFRPTVLLPEEAHSWSAQRLHVVLSHELAHVKRWDYLTHLVAQCACAVFWLNPLVWLAKRQLHIKQELACDDHVLRGGAIPHEYAEHLLDLVRAFQNEPRALKGAVAMSRSPALKHRVKAILSNRHNRRPLTKQAGLLIAVLGGFAVLPVAALQVGNTPPQSQDTEHRNYLWLETEETTLPPLLKRRRAETASGNQYVAVVADESSYESSPNSGRATYAFRAPRAGTYVVWGRVLAPNEDENSFWVRIDDGSWIRWNGIEQKNHWVWDDVHNADKDDKVVRFELAKGKHTLEIAYREKGVKIDKLLITNDWTYRPRSAHPVPPMDGAQRLWLEAEEGWLLTPMRTKNHPGASHWRYIEAAADDDNADSPPQAGRAVYRFQVARTGIYHVWGRVLAPDSGDNSFWIRIDEGPWIRWNGIETSTHWIWDEVHDADKDDKMVGFELAEGRHTLEIAYREEDTKLDRLLITDDPAYRPRGPGPARSPNPFHLWLEPENGSLQAPMQAQTDPAASNQRFITVPDGPGNDAPGGGPGYVEIRFAIPRTDEYVLWGRVRAPHSNDNSFYVAIDGGDEVAWHIPKSEATRADWAWVPVGSEENDQHVTPVIYSLTEGQHVLRIRNREDGTLLDRLLITNSPGLEARALAATP